VRAGEFAGEGTLVQPLGVRGSDDGIASPLPDHRVSSSPLAALLQAQPVEHEVVCLSDRPRPYPLFAQGPVDRSLMDAIGDAQRPGGFASQVPPHNLGVVIGDRPGQASRRRPVAAFDAGLAQDPPDHVAVNPELLAQRMQRLAILVQPDDLGVGDLAPGRLGKATQRNASLTENPADHVAVDAELLAQRPCGCAVLVAADEVISVEVVNPGRHGAYVYTLESSTGAYRTTRVVHRNCRSAAWWAMRELLDPATGDPVALPPDDLLIGDLTAPHWRVLSGGRIQIESKDDLRKRLGRSTDTGDAVVQAFWSRSRVGSFAGMHMATTRIWSG
jgi:hypothetical protein